MRGILTARQQLPTLLQGTSETLSDEVELKKRVTAWLTPLTGDDGPCGPDLEYDNAFLDLIKAAEGKPETQFEKGTPPEWRNVLGKIESVFERTRDLRVAMLWLRSMLATQGMTAFPVALQLVCGLLETQWDALHPRPDPDDKDPYARANALAGLPKVDGVLGEILNARLVALKGVGEVRLRDVEVAFGVLTARKGETTFTREQIDQMIAAADKDQAGVRVCLVDTQTELKRLGGLMDSRFGPGSGSELKPVLDVVAHALSLTHEPEVAAAEVAGGDGATEGGGAAAKPKAGISGTVTSRAEAMRAIDLVCAYLDQHEPTNPAPLFLRRARTLLERNFLELLKELAPAALQDVAKSVGVDPATIGPPGPAPAAPAKK
jgi:type VI secretion system protein ImpA